MGTKINVIYLIFLTRRSHNEQCKMGCEINSELKCVRNVPPHLKWTILSIRRSHVFSSKITLLLDNGEFNTDTTTHLNYSKLRQATAGTHCKSHTLQATRRSVIIDKINCLRISHVSEAGLWLRQAAIKNQDERRRAMTNTRILYLRVPGLESQPTAENGAFHFLAAQAVREFHELSRLRWDIS